MSSRAQQHVQRRAQTPVAMSMKPFVAAILVGLAASASIAMPAFAQDQVGPAPASTAATALKAVVVTGSLIPIPNAVSSSPIVSIDMSTLKQTTGDTELVSVLNQMPQFNSTSSAFASSDGHATLNLRGLGSNRNLVLLDGRRLPLADSSGAVDINLIPDAAIGNVDTITGGASAVYGSDAMSGVVNFHTIPYFEGLKGDVHYGNSFDRVVAQKSTSVALGTAFAEGKGNALLAFGYSDRQEMKGTRRDFFKYTIPSSYIGPGTFVPDPGNLPSQTAANSIFSKYGSLTSVPRSQEFGFNDDGTLFLVNGATNYKGPTDNGYAILGGNVRMPVGPQYILSQPLKRKQAFSKFDFEVTPNLTLYGQFMYVKSDVDTASGLSLSQFAPYLMIPTSNPFVPTDLKTLLASRPDPTAPFRWKGRYVGVPLKTFDYQNTVEQYLLGGYGNLPFGDWTYDVYASYDSTGNDQNVDHAILKSRVQNLFSAPDGGNLLCAGGFDPFGIAGSTNISQSCLAYMTTTAHSQEKLSQNIFQGMIQGSLFELPAGSVKAAFLADERRNSYSYTPDTSLAEGQIEALQASAPAKGNIRVKEAAVQVNVPLLANVPFAKSLDLDAAYRRSDYDASGSVAAYEGDVKWHPVDSLLIRAGYQHAVRAPNIGELYAAAQGGQVGFGTPPGSLGDPCDIRSAGRTGAGGTSVRQLCLQQGIPASIIDDYTFATTASASLTSGNPNLKPETANTFNVGFQWMSASDSEIFRSMTASLDYYNIDIKQVISVVPGLTTLSKCYNQDGSNPGYSQTNIFCQLIHRDATGQLSEINTPYLNLGGLRTSGMDLEFSWSPSLSSLGLSMPGSVFLNSYLSYVNSFEVQTLPGASFQNFVNTIGTANPANSHPRWKALNTLGYRNQNITVAVRWHYLGAMADASSITSPTRVSPGTPSYSLYDFFGTYWLSDRIQIRAGINNLADKRSVVVASATQNTITSIFDPIGRTYFIGLNFSM